MSTYIHYIIYKFKNLVTEERNQPPKNKINKVTLKTLSGKPEPMFSVA